MITLGINAAFHDSAAAVVVDGVVVAAAEEERYSRIKHAKRPLPFSAWELPFGAIVGCLERAGATLADVDHVAYSLDPELFAAGRDDLRPARAGSVLLPIGRQPEPPLRDWDSPWDPLFLAYVLTAREQLLDGAPHHLYQRLTGRSRHAPAAAPRFEWHHVGHHLCHQASAFLAAPFESCAVMTLDGRGERATTTYGVWRGNRYRPLGSVEMPHSLGLLYERVTVHLGFLGSSDEYKVMALAAMGVPRWAAWLRQRIVVKADGRYEVLPFAIDEIAGPPREPGAALEQRHLDLTASLQSALESTVLDLAGWLRETSGERALAMAGGVALNCLMNARLRDAGIFDRVWVQPAAGDAGTALGAALWTDAVARRQEGDGDGALPPRRWTMTHAYLGPDWSDAAIELLLQWADVPYEAIADEAALVARTAALLQQGAIVGWFQGRMEWGPRALGARSILASPIDAEMQQRLNDLKDREDFRPVAPLVTQEAFGDWFEHADRNGGTSPFMLFTYDVKAAQRERIPSACHSDGSARVQTVDAASNPRLHALLRAFEARTGVPVLVNTSFNVRGEPVVCSPKDALEAWIGTPLDALVVGRALLTKRSWP